MKILLDHNRDWRLKRHLLWHRVSTARDKGWSEVENDELLALAGQDGFEVFITADAHIEQQQNFRGRSISLICLRAPNNILSTHVSMGGEIEKALSIIQPGKIVEIYYQP